MAYIKSKRIIPSIPVDIILGMHNHSRYGYFINMFNFK